MIPGSDTISFGVNNKGFSTNSVTTFMDKIHAKANTTKPCLSVQDKIHVGQVNSMPSYASVQHKKVDGSLDRPKKPRPLSLAKHLMHKLTKSATCLPEDEASTSEHQLSPSRSLQNIYYFDEFPDITHQTTSYSNSEPDIFACASSPLYENIFLQVPLMTHAVKAKASKDVMRPTSNSFSYTEIENICDNVLSMVSSNNCNGQVVKLLQLQLYMICFSGFHLDDIKDHYDYADEYEDDGLYVIDHIDHYIDHYIESKRI